MEAAKSATPKGTLQEYFDLERSGDQRHEFHGVGQIVAMAGGSANHARIARNVVNALQARFEGRPCESFGSDMRLKVERLGRYFYPDASALCGDTQIINENGQQSLVNPQLLVEVLSPTTLRTDFSTKVDAYMAIPSLKAYVLIEQDSARLTIIARNAEGGWSLSRAVGLEDTLRLPWLDVEIPMSAIYRDVELPAPDEPTAAQTANPT